MLLWLLITTQELAPMQTVKPKHEDKYMVSSRILTRREFCANFPLIISAALADWIDRPAVPARKFNLGDRVIGERICDDNRSKNFGGIDWEKGNIVGYCWEYDDWLIDEFKQGWTYFVRFDETNYLENFIFPFISFEHESFLKLIA